jgi:hypothetical protein
MAEFCIRLAPNPASQGAVAGREELRALAAKANVPVTTTLHAMGVFDEEDPLSLHMLGMHGSAYANFAIQARYYAGRRIAAAGARELTPGWRGAHAGGAGA